MVLATLVSDLSWLQPPLKASKLMRIITPVSRTRTHRTEILHSLPLPWIRHIYLAPTQSILHSAARVIPLLDILISLTHIL